MITLDIEDDGLYHDLYTLSGLEEGKSVTIYNRGREPLYILQAASQPSPDIEHYYACEIKREVLVHGNDEKIWVKGSGDVTVQLLAGTITPFTSVELPHYLYSSDNEDVRRVAVDVARTSFYEGREFRTFKELNIVTGTTYLVRIVVPVNIILYNVEVVLDQGSVKFSGFVGGTPVGTFSETLPIIPKNNTTTVPVPVYSPQVVITAIPTGGTHSEGTQNDVARIVSVNQQNSRFTIGGRLNEERGVGPGTYYFKLESFGASDALGVLSAYWEEKP